MKRFGRTVGWLFAFRVVAVVAVGVGGSGPLGQRVALADDATPGGRPASSPARSRPQSHTVTQSHTVRPKAEVSAEVVDAGALAVVEAKTLDGGTKVFRFGEVEVEGRLKSPQIVYFLRRVRAEFGAEDLGHRTFLHELSSTRKEPAF